MDDGPNGSMEDELEDSQEPAQRRPSGALGDWEKIGWMAARLNRRVPGVEFMSVLTLFVCLFLRFFEYGVYTHLVIPQL